MTPGFLSGTFWLAALALAQEGQPPRQHCNPEDPVNRCPGDRCACTDDALRMDFPASGSSLLEADSWTPGTAVEAFLVLDAAAEPALMWSCGVKNDPEHLRLESVDLEGTIAKDLATRGFVVADMKSILECLDGPRCAESREGSGFITAFVLSDVLINAGILPIEGGRLIHARYTIVKDPGSAGTFVTITNRLKKRGSPPADIAVTVQGVSKSPHWLTDGWIKSAAKEHPFHRGDVDGDGRVNVTDALSILTYLFRRGPAPACRESADFNDVEGINVTDAISLLQWLFAGAPPPASPGPPPGPCGPDRPDSPSNLGCLDYSQC